MPELLSPKEAATLLGLLPREFARQLYRLGPIIDQLAPRVGTRRVIPVSNLNAIRELLPKRKPRRTAAIAAAK
jgi:hypothetical protein